jgi:catechol 2,3-dioxygenase-like lactoylglutathione lyase family enzyme
MPEQEDLVPVPEMKLELVPIPVSDVDRAKEFYLSIGFGDLHDTQVTPEMRVVQLTPPGSACAIVFGTGMAGISDMVPGSVKGIHLVVEDIHQGRQAMVQRGVAATEVVDMGGVFYSDFDDPDGNTWVLQQVPWQRSPHVEASIRDSEPAAGPSHAGVSLSPIMLPSASLRIATSTPPPTSWTSSTMVAPSCTRADATSRMPSASKNGVTRPTSTSTWRQHGPGNHGS